MTARQTAPERASINSKLLGPRESTITVPPWLCDSVCAAFDCVWTIQTQMNIAEKRQFYGEITRVLRPGGRLLILDFGRPAGPVQAEWAVVYLHGFSASRQELAPLPEDVTGQFGPQLTALIAYLTVVCRLPPFRNSTLGMSLCVPN